MRYSLELCALYARFNRPIVFVGPVGAGKTTLARAVFRLARAAGVFVVIGSGELGETLYSDTLFGHRPGAYTGAAVGRRGAFAEAADGCLLLDDLALMPVAAQAAILRVIETGSYRRLGSEQDERATCRILFASTVPPRELVTSGELLPDLASRLGEFVVPVPPLRARLEDILVIARRCADDLLQEHQVTAEVVFGDEVEHLLRSYDWPGNVRELRGVVERAVVHAGVKEGVALILPAHLPERIRLFDPESAAHARAELTSALVARALREAGGNKSEAARRLGVHRNTVGRYLRSAG